MGKKGAPSSRARHSNPAEQALCLLDGGLSCRLPASGAPGRRESSCCYGRLPSPTSPVFLDDQRHQTIGGSLVCGGGLTNCRSSHKFDLGHLKLQFPCRGDGQCIQMFPPEGSRLLPLQPIGAYFLQIEQGRGGFFPSRLPCNPKNRTSRRRRGTPHANTKDA